MYKRAGYKATAESCVQYFMLNAEEHGPLRRQDQALPADPPEGESDLLWSHLAAGHCDFISSDHVSWGLEKKGDPMIFKNTSGGPGIETLLPALWTGCEEHGLSPTIVVKQLCGGRPRPSCLPTRGRLEAGADADITVLEPGRFIHDPSKSLSAVKWSSMEGREFRVRVAATYVRGQLAWDGKAIRNKAGDGRFLHPAA